jgi:hypothetical protein
VAKRQISEAPVYTVPDYRERYTEACVVEQKDGRDWHVGRGIHQSRHPLGHRFGDLRCVNCDIDYATVIAASVVTSAETGKSELTYEFRCDACGKYNQVTDTE